MSVHEQERKPSPVDIDDERAEFHRGAAFFEATGYLRDLLAVEAFGTRYSTLEEPELVDFAANDQARYEYGGEAFASVAIVNPNAFPVYVGLGAGAGKPGGEFATVAASGYLVLPLRAKALSIGGGTHAGSIYLFPFATAQPFAAGPLGPNPVNLGVPLASTTGTATKVAAAVATTTLLAANANRVGATVYSDSTAVLYLLLDAGATVDNYTVALNDGDYYEVPAGYSGEITGVWSAAAGQARVTELT